MTSNTRKSHLLIFGHKLEHQWAQIGKDMVWQENKNNSKNNRQLINI